MRRLIFCLALALALELGLNGLVVWKIGRTSSANMDGIKTALDRAGEFASLGGSTASRGPALYRVPAARSARAASAREGGAPGQIAGSVQSVIEGVKRAAAGAVSSLGKPLPLRPASLDGAS